MSDEIKRRINAIYAVFDQGIDNIAEWNRQLPSMQQTKEQLRWMRDSIDSAPPELTNTTDEYLLDYLEKSFAGTAVIRSIPSPTLSLVPVVTTSGSVLPNVYNQYVRRVAYEYRASPDVTKWAGVTVTMGDEIQAKLNKSDVVQHRLTLLRPADLPGLHKEATDLCLKSQATGDRNPIGAAMALNRLLEQFKGALIDKCRGGDGTRYSRISDRLAANSALTTTVVNDGQITYDRINLELVQIRKSMTTTSKNRVVEILHEIEDHIIIITDALDPTKLGISF